MARRPLEEVIADGRLCCPRCHGSFAITPGCLACAGCDTAYPIGPCDVPMLAPVETDAEAKDIQRFWASLYAVAYGTTHGAMNGHELAALLDDLEDLFRHREHLAAVEMPSNLRGCDVLEVGSGAGAHSALFARRGARVAAVDLTPERATATARKFDLLPEAEGLAVQGDARALPFPDCSFDIVYSNGVLHHSPRIEEAIAELHRVLKPGGKAVAMLYAKNSFLYRGVLFPVRGVLQGGVFRDRRWLGRATEWMSSRPQTVTNPWTEVFSGTEVQHLFSQFSTVMIRKGSFTFEQIPVIGRLLGRAVGRRTGWNRAGVLVYDEPWRNESALELRLGSTVGWALNIQAVK